jgi:Secretion system C-terminal sorting domain
MMSINQNKSLAKFALADAGHCKIEILDSRGGVLETLIIEDANMEINFSKYTAGNYTIKLETENQTIVKSIEIK